MEGVFVLNVIVRQSAAVLQLLALEDEANLVDWDGLGLLHLAGDHLLEFINSGSWVTLERGGAAAEHLHEDFA